MGKKDEYFLLRKYLQLPAKCERITITGMWPIQGVK